MTTILSALTPYLSILAPPLLGAFIGYLTNRVAIRMLFRPLKPWRLFGLRVPMTPGVIPSKRHELALNIGEMVGEHLLTSKELGYALEKKKFQDHLYGLIKERGGAILKRDLGPLVNLIPKQYQNYYFISVHKVTFHLKKSIHDFIYSDNFSLTIQRNIEQRFEDFLDRDLDTLFNSSSRQTSYAFLEKNLSRMMVSPTMEQWVEDFVHQKVHGVLRKAKTCEEILPDSLTTLIIQTIEEQTPALLVKFADILKEPEIQDKIVGGVKEGVENFIESLGPMSNMVNNFLSMEVVEEKVREYLKDKEDDIVGWLQNEDVQERVAETIRERTLRYLQTPICDFVSKGHMENVNGFCGAVSRQILTLLRDASTTSALTNMIRDNIEVHIQGGSLTVREILKELAGIDSSEKCRSWINDEVIQLLRSEESIKTLDAMVDSMIASLLAKRVGRLSNMLPAGVRDGMYRSVQKMASAMLATEVPGLVDSLDLRHIVAEKVDSLDLLRLERLLLSIMEEQFKYINLFGALLGFIIGCCNLIFLYGL